MKKIISISILSIIGLIFLPACSFSEKLPIPISLLPVKGLKERGWQPLHFAAQEGDKKMVEFLILVGEDINARNDCNQTPLHLPLLYQNANGTPLHKNTETAALLISSGADVNARDKGGETPLHYASDRGYEKIVSLLIAKGADINARNDVNETPLHKAANGGYFKIVKILVANGADVNLKDSNGHTPLHIAVQSGYKKMVKFLLRHGADATIKDNYGRTPSQMPTVSY
jgi:ankyrin repeat protein